LAKPSVSAWAVNQLYWHHRDAFETLLAAGQRVREAQTSGTAGRLVGMRKALDARRESLSDLSDLATSLLQDAGHNPSPDTIRRITTTLEALSALESFSDGPTPGRLSQDVDPPGFESLASFMSGAVARTTSEPPRITASQKSGAVETASRVTTTKSRYNTTTARDAQRLEEARQARIATAKSLLQVAKKSLAVARARAQRLEAAQKKAEAEAKQADKQLREAEERFTQATAAAESASERAQSIAAEAEEAANAVADAETAFEDASDELESLLSQT
jgi:DNA repair exonuclease SbcCD ATPase subunit